MNNLEFNKIFASLLVALLCMQVFHLIGEGLVHPVYLTQNILGIDEERRLLQMKVLKNLLNQ